MPYIKNRAPFKIENILGFLNESKKIKKSRSDKMTVKIKRLIQIEIFKLSNDIEIQKDKKKQSG